MHIYDIAKEAGVSTATVSRVLNNKSNVSPQTQRRVKNVLEKYNYAPSFIARGLMSNTMNLVGVVMRDIRHPHYNAFAYTIEQELARNGYGCIISNADDRKTANVLRIFSQIKVSGIMIIGSDFMTPNTEAAVEEYHPQTPIVFLNGYLNRPNVINILADDRSGIIQCVEHLFARGRKRPVYVNDNNTNSAQRKREGFVDAMIRAGYIDYADRIVESELGFEGGKLCAGAILERFGDDVDCIVCAEDTTALGCMYTLERMGKRVPEDIAITGFSNTAECKMCNKLLTSVDTKLEMMSVEATLALCDRINGKNRASGFTIMPELFIGETT